MEINSLVNGIKNNNRLILSKAITIIESSLPEDRTKALKLLDACTNKKKSIRIGISGTPGVGKSTFIQSLGAILIKENYKIAILTIDPSSITSKGSILGDKTRMTSISNHKNVFIRPSPNKGYLGGVSTSTRDVIQICEEAGYNIIIIETVGVGQSEVTVQAMTDFCLYLTLKENGDELQFIKKGAFELSDFIIINKSDLNPDKSEATRIILNHHLKLSSTNKSKVFTCSALNNKNINLIWENLYKSFKKKWKSGKIQDKRKNQSLFWLKKMILEEYIFQIKNNKNLDFIINKYQLEKINNPRKKAIEIIKHLALK